MRIFLLIAFDEFVQTFRVILTLTNGITFYIRFFIFTYFTGNFFFLQKIYFFSFL